MKIKVIDLLNKIANGEVPEKIKVDDDIYRYNSLSISIDSLYTNGIDWLSQKDLKLDDTVEIIVEEPEIDIQGIEELKPFSGCMESNKKINELIKALKQLDNKIKGK